MSEIYTTVIQGLVMKCLSTKNLLSYHTQYFNRSIRQLRITNFCLNVKRFRSLRQQLLGLGGSTINLVLLITKKTHSFLLLVFIFLRGYLHSNGTKLNVCLFFMLLSTSLNAFKRNNCGCKVNWSFTSIFLSNLLILWLKLFL